MAKEHNLIIENRNRLLMGGVIEVISFDEESILLQTNMGNITIKGDMLKIEGFNTDTGDLTANGKINAVVYMSDIAKDKNLFSKIFR